MRPSPTTCSTRAESDVDDRQRVVLLQRDPGGAAVGRDGDVLRLEVLGDRRPAVGGVASSAPVMRTPCRSSASRSALKRRKSADRATACSGAAADVDHADRTFGIDRVVVARFAFVGREHVAAVGRERDHVGQRADADDGDRLRRLRLVRLLPSETARCARRRSSAARRRPPRPGRGSRRRSSDRRTSTRRTGRLPCRCARRVASTQRSAPLPTRNSLAAAS